MKENNGEAQITNFEGYKIMGFLYNAIEYSETAETLKSQVF